MLKTKESNQPFVGEARNGWFEHRTEKCEAVFG